MHLIEKLFTFRNTEHLIWFIITFGLFLIFSIIAFIERKSMPVLKSMAVTSFAVSISAIVVVLILDIKSNAYSVDCIWCNSLLGSLYLLVYYFAKK